MLPRRRFLPVVLALALIAPPAARAQSLWPTALRGRAEFGLEWVRPTFQSGDDAFSGTRGVWILSGRFHPTPRLNAVVAIPRLVATDADGGSTMGDPYAGIEFLKDDGTPEFSLGTRIDMVDNTFGGGPQVAYFGDYDRFEEAISHAFTITATGYHEPYRTDDGTFARIRFGATFFHPTEDGAGADNDLYFNYGIRMGRETPSLRFSVELTGRWFLTANGANFAQATVHQGAATASFFSGQIRPYVGIRIPVDEDLKATLTRALIFGVTASVD
jgi:hypothetical protein